MALVGAPQSRHARTRGTTPGLMMTIPTTRPLRRILRLGFGVHTPCCVLAPGAIIPRHLHAQAYATVVLDGAVSET